MRTADRPADGGFYQGPKEGLIPSRDSTAKPPRTMLIGTFDEKEVELLIVALRYWRSQRGSLLRKSDPAVSSEALDLLLAKLRACAVTSLSSDDPSDPLANLFRK
jgi:hypothetical protein